MLRTDRLPAAVLFTIFRNGDRIRLPFEAVSCIPAIQRVTRTGGSVHAAHIQFFAGFQFCHAPGLRRVHHNSRLILRINFWIDPAHRVPGVCVPVVGSWIQMHFNEIPDQDRIKLQLFSGHGLILKIQAHAALCDGPCVCPVVFPGRSGRIGPAGKSKTGDVDCISLCIHKRSSVICAYPSMFFCSGNVGIKHKIIRFSLIIDI